MEWSTATKCTVALMATILGCTYWVVTTIQHASPSGSEYEAQLSAIQSGIEGINHRVDEVVENTQSIDRRLMSPEERYQDIRRSFPPATK